MTFRFSTYERQSSGPRESRLVQNGPTPISVNMNQGQVLPPQEDSFTRGLSGAMQIFNRFAETKAAQELQDRNQRELLQGMSMAAQGQAIDEIANGRSKLDKFFDNTNLMEGAKAYYTANEGNRVIEEIQNDMEDMFALNPDEARQKIQNKINAVKTGDEATDMQVRMQIMKRIPQLMKTQAKGHYDWQQEQMLRVQSNYMQSNAATLAQQLKQTSRDPSTNPKDIGVMLQDFAAGLMPVEGQNKTAWAKNVTQGIQLAAEQAGRPRTFTKSDGSTATETGDLWTLELYRQSGVIDALPAQQQKQALDAIEAAEGRARKKFAEDFSRPLAELSAMAVAPTEGMTAKQINAEIDNLNREYMEKTGSSIPLIDSGERKGYLEKSMLAITREREKRMERQERINERIADRAERRRERLEDRKQRMAERAAERAADRAEREAIEAAKEAAKVKAENDKAASIISFGDQAWSMAKRGYAFSEADVQKVAAQRVDGAATFDEKLAVMKHFSGQAIKGVSDDLQRQVIKIDENPDFAQKNPDTLIALADRFNKMRSELGPDMTERYYGKDIYARLANFSTDYEATGNATAAWMHTDVTSKKGFSDYKEASKIAQEIIDDKRSSFLGFEWGETSGIKGANEQVLKDALAREADSALRLANGDTEAAKRIAADRVLNAPDSKVMRVGDFVMSANGLSADERITSYISSSNVRKDGKVSIPPDEVGDVINDVLKEEFYGANGKPGRIDQTVNWFFKNKAAGTQLTQVQHDGKPALLVTAFGEDDAHTPITFVVTADRLVDHYNDKRIKGKKSPAKMIGEAIDSLTPDFLKSTPEFLK